MPAGALEACTLESYLTPELRAIQPDRHQRAIPQLAKDTKSTAQILDLLAKIKTSHEVILGDARTVRLPPKSIHLVVTSPPYWTLKEYPDTAGQMGRTTEYAAFLSGLREVWEGCYDALVPGGRWCA